MIMMRKIITKTKQQGFNVDAGDFSIVGKFTEYEYDYDNCYDYD